MRAIDLTGQVFGRLTAIEATAQRRVGGSVVWRCFCSCGEVRFVSSGCLRKGDTRSCGCLQREISQHLGLSNAIVCPYSPRRLEEIYKNGTPITGIADQANVSPGTVSRWLLAAGVELRQKEDSARLAFRRCRKQTLENLARARQNSAALKRSGQIDISWLRTPEAQRRRLRSFKMTIKVRQGKIQAQATRQQAEREQSEAIERALNGDTFK